MNEFHQWLPSHTNSNQCFDWFPWELFSIFMTQRYRNIPLGNSPEFYKASNTLYFLPIVTWIGTFLMAWPWSHQCSSIWNRNRTGHLLVFKFITYVYCKRAYSTGNTIKIDDISCWLLQASIRKPFSAIKIMANFKIPKILIFVSGWSYRIFCLDFWVKLNFYIATENWISALKEILDSILSCILCRGHLSRHEIKIFKFIWSLMIWFSLWFYWSLHNSMEKFVFFMMTLCKGQ